MNKSERPRRTWQQLALSNGLVSILLGVIIFWQLEPPLSVEQWLIVVVIVCISWGLGMLFDRLRLKR